MDLRAVDVCVLDSVVDDIGEPVEEVISVSTTERDHNLMVLRRVADEAKGVQQLILDDGDLIDVWHVIAGLTAVPGVKSRLGAVGSA